MIFQHGCPKIIQWGKEHSSTDVAGKTGNPYAKKWSWTLSLYHMKKINSKMDWRHKCKSQSYKILGRKHSEKASQHWIWQWFLGYDTKRRDKLEYSKIEQFCALQDTNQQSKMVIHRMGKITYKLYIWWGVNIQNTKKSYNLTTQNSILIWAKDLRDISPNGQ